MYLFHKHDIISHINVHISGFPSFTCTKTQLAPGYRTCSGSIHDSKADAPGWLWNMRSNGDGCDLRNLLLYRLFIAIFDHKIQPNVGIYTVHLTWILWVVIDLFALFCMSCAFICVGSRELFHNFLYILSLVSCVVSNISICIYLRVYFQYMVLWLFIFSLKNTLHMFIENISTNRYGYIYICYVFARMLSLCITFPFPVAKRSNTARGALMDWGTLPQKNDANGYRINFSTVNQRYQRYLKNISLNNQ